MSVVSVSHTTRAPAAVTLVLSVCLHVGAAGGVVAALSAHDFLMRIAPWALPAPDEPPSKERTTPPQSPERSPDAELDPIVWIQPGIDDAQSKSQAWIGYKDETEHTAHESTIDQSAMTTDLPGAQGETAAVTPPAPEGQPLTAAAEPPAEPSPPSTPDEVAQAPAASPPPPSDAVAPADAAPTTTPEPVEGAKPQEQPGGPSPEVKLPLPEAQPVPESAPEVDTPPAVTSPEVAKTPDDVAQPSPPPSPSVAPETPHPITDPPAQPPPPSPDADAVGQAPPAPPVPVEVSQAPPMKKPGAAPSPVPAGAPGEKSDKEADATSIKKAVEYRLGRVKAGAGIDIKTVRPEFSDYTVVTALPRPPVVEITFTTSGKVKNVRLLQSSGYKGVDEPILNAVWAWTAKGKKLDEIAKNDPDALLKISVRMML